MEKSWRKASQALQFFSHVWNPNCAQQWNSVGPIILASGDQPGAMNLHWGNVDEKYQVEMEKKKCNMYTVYNKHNYTIYYSILYIYCVHIVYTAYCIYIYDPDPRCPGTYRFHYITDTCWVDIHLLPVSAWSKSLGSFCKDFQDWPGDLEIPCGSRSNDEISQFWGLLQWRRMRKGWSPLLVSTRSRLFFNWNIE